MIRRPPKSPLFPTPPLFRSPRNRRCRPPQLSSASHAKSPPGTIRLGLVPFQHPSGQISYQSFDRIILVRRLITRSEEHTSELQSRPHLVCRLLLEKKKKTNT